MLESLPIELCTGVAFASGCDVLVSGHVAYGVVLNDGGGQLIQGGVLCRLKWPIFQSFELNADRKIVAIVTSKVVRAARVPRPIIATDELPQLAVTLNVEVSRYLQAPNLRQPRVRIPVQLIGK